MDFGGGDFAAEEIDHETKVMELMTPFGRRDQEKSPVGQKIGERPKSQGAKKKKSQTKKAERPQSHTSGSVYFRNGTCYFKFSIKL